MSWAMGVRSLLRQEASPWGSSIGQEDPFEGPFFDGWVFEEKSFVGLREVSKRV
jgi:hypothetical protein